MDEACEEELASVLARGFTRRAFDAAACIEECRRLARHIEAPLAPAVRARLPACRDPDDQKFLEAALAAGAQFLVTKDAELLALARKPLPFRIIAPVQWPNYTKSV
jgi:predicted nucleic acid-binding protein